MYEHEKCLRDSKVVEFNIVSLQLATLRQEIYDNRMKRNAAARARYHKKKAAMAVVPAVDVDSDTDLDLDQRDIDPDEVVDFNPCQVDDEPLEAPMTIFDNQRQQLGNALGELAKDDVLMEQITTELCNEFQQHYDSGNWAADDSFDTPRVGTGRIQLLRFTN